MKAFEKKWESLTHVTLQEKNQIEWGWKAALEWVLSQIYEHREPMDVIEEELRD